VKNKCKTIFLKRIAMFSVKTWRDANLGLRFLGLLRNAAAAAKLAILSGPGAEQGDLMSL
jgi:hypothetical protein